MQTVDLATWEDFEAHIQALAIRRAESRRGIATYVSEQLFRGHASSDWALETTLERFTGQLTSLLSYYRTICKTRPIVATFTDKTWDDLPDMENYEKQIGDEQRLLPGRFPAYAYLVYLRHHGFPSPLLDWTKSPYVAAYFAFRDVSSNAKKVAIYAFCEFTTGHKIGSGNAPEITGLGPYVQSHRRHFQQQSAYTICTVCQNGQLVYARHQDVFDRANEDQDELIKFVLPASERLKVLQNLDLHNINAYSLFGSEDSLMETVAIREMFLRQR